MYFGVNSIHQILLQSFHKATFILRNTFLICSLKWFYMAESILYIHVYSNNVIETGYCDDGNRTQQCKSLEEKILIMEA